jgi:hypothetical protein
MHGTRGPGLELRDLTEWTEYVDVNLTALTDLIVIDGMDVTSGIDGIGQQNQRNWQNDMEL